ncbi:hypothetical protein DPMN_101905 [Dreissena polymorpha]|uniref:Uncharacterized protein n=2 Tax=Dreissena polymorpha TaxID=45954 RepID=A0A9D4LJW3_DREPO|nr:hypothetical protein DPMN_101905 [Dreissena polymorpha]
MNKRLKVSTDELKTCLFVVMYRDQSPGENVMQYYQHLIASLAGKENKPHERVVELLKYKGMGETRKAIETWNMPRFPISGKDLLEMNVKKGPVFSKALGELRRRWIESDFQMTREELLDTIGEVLSDIRS